MGCFSNFWKKFSFTSYLGHFWTKISPSNFRPRHRVQGWSNFLLFMFWYWVNAWGCFYHNLKIFIFRLYLWAKLWSKTFERIWEGLDCLISLFFMFIYSLGKLLVMFFSILLTSWICFISRAFLCLTHPKIGPKPIGCTSEGMGFSITFNLFFSWGFALIFLLLWLFFWKHKSKIDFD